MPSWTILLPIAIPWVGAAVVWLLGDENRKALNITAVLFSALAGIASLALIPLASSTSTIHYPMGTTFEDFTLVPDGLGVMLSCIATIIGSLAVVFSIDYMKEESQLARYYAFILLFIGGMTGLVLTGNLFFLFLFWEVTALCSYALISFHNDDPKAVAGGMKALIMTQVGGAGLLVGALVIFVTSGSLDINNFLSIAGKYPVAILAIPAFGFLIAAAAKSAQFPFQTWLPDAMEAPTPISALIHAATMVNAGVYILARFYPAFSAVPYWKLAVLIVGVVTALLAAFMALVATDIKRVLAYSTVSQLGYMVFAIGAGSVYASQFHLLSHAIFKALLFLCAGAIIHGVGTRDMTLMGGLGKKIPVIRTLFIIGGLALVGIPVLNGFWSKELILEAGLESAPIFTWLMYFGAGLTALYTTRCIWMVFYGEERSELHAHDAGTAMRVALFPLAVGTLISWLIAGPIASLFAKTLPFHEIHVLPTGEILREVVTAPATYAALLVIALGISLWFIRERLVGLTDAFSFISSAAENSFGFEKINGWIYSGTQYISEKLRGIQTGLVSWNIVGIIAGLLIILAVLVWRA